MTYEEKNAVYALNSYTWKLLEANLSWTRWNGVPPIIPVQQQPEIMQSGKPFIVYGSAIHPPEHLHALNKEAVAYMVYATTATEVNKICNLLSETFRRQDESADDVNDWLVIEAGSRTGGHRGVHFATVKTMMVEKAENAAEEEGGYFAALVLIEAKYTIDSGVIQTTGFTP